MLIDTINNIAIFIFENLPSGGGRKSFNNNVKYLKKRYKVVKVKTSEIKNSKTNFGRYLLEAIIFAPIKHYVASRQIRKFSKNKRLILIAYPSWITKAPFILTKYPF